MTETLVDVLTRAKDRISNPEHWCQNYRALHDVNGTPIKWCAYGAIDAEESPLKGEAAALLENMAYKRYLDSVVIVNDIRGHAAVMKIYDDAISQAERGARGRVIMN